jgi:hypothetical protein
MGSFGLTLSDPALPKKQGLSPLYRISFLSGKAEKLSLSKSLHSFSAFYRNKKLFDKKEGQIHEL